MNNCDDVIDYSLSFRDRKSINLLYVCINSMTDDEVTGFVTRFIDEWHERSEESVQELGDRLSRTWSPDAREIAIAIRYNNVDRFINTINRIVQDQSFPFRLDLDLTNMSFLNRLQSLEHFYWLLWDRIENQFNTDPISHELDQHLLDTIDQIAHDIVSERYNDYHPMISIVTENMKLLASDLQWVGSYLIDYIFNNYQSYQNMWNDEEEFEELLNVLSNQDLDDHIEALNDLVSLSYSDWEALTVADSIAMLSEYAEYLIDRYDEQVFYEISTILNDMYDIPSDVSHDTLYTALLLEPTNPDVPLDLLVRLILNGIQYNVRDLIGVMKDIQTL